MTDPMPQHMSIRSQDDYELQAHAIRMWEDCLETVDELERRGWKVQVIDRFALVFEEPRT